MSKIQLTFFIILISMVSFSQKSNDSESSNRINFIPPPYKMKDSNLPVYANINGKFCRFRIEKKKDEYLYYVDIPENDKYIIGQTPFHKGSEIEGYSFDIYLFFFDDNVQLKVYHKDYSKNKVGYYDRLKIINFDSNFNFKSTIDFTAPVNSRIHKLTTQNIDNEIYFFTWELNSENKKTLFKVYNFKDSNKNLLEGVNQNLEVKELKILKNKDNIYLYTLCLNESNWSSILYIKEDNNFSKINEENFKNEQINRDYKDNVDLKYLANIYEYFLTDIYYDMDDTYLIVTATKFVEHRRYFSSILITKISANEIIWNQYIKRYSKSFDPNNPGNIPSLNFQTTKNEIIINDTECAVFFDEKGNYIVKGDDFFNKNFVNVDYFLNKENGELTRKLKR